MPRSTVSARPTPVLLLHGVWLVGSTLRVLAARLRDAGFAPECLGYPSVRGGPQPSIARLRERWTALGDDGPVHVVGHSLGGLIALGAAKAGTLPPGRIVCLGSPLAGSRAARTLARLPFGARLTGRSHALLCAGCTALPPGREVGVIAGRTALGIGALWTGFDGANDGTVAVAETRIDGLADHLELPATHTGLLLSRAVADHTIRFLDRGRF